MCKRIIRSALFAAALLSSCGHDAKKAELILGQYVYDFGSIGENEIHRGSTVITNTGTDTLRIGQVQAGCGCTDVDVSKLRIAPGDTALLSFVYDTSGKFGRHKENIIIAADTDSLMYLFQFTALVEAGFRE